MEQFDYIIPFISIIYGIAIADLLSSVYRLVEERQRVRMHPIPFIWAAVCFTAIINGWWAFFQIMENFTVKSAGNLFILSFLPTLTFLFSSAVLPSRISSECDLWMFYRKNRVIFFGTFAAYLLSVPTILYLLFDQFNQLYVISQLVGCLLLILCILVERQWLHWLISLYFAYNIAAGLFNQTLNSLS
ncbi:hypothetical protein [Alteromonas ponticola]|uniref:Lycopene cyclase domain-containing protein n=1 Tax=Alteromonas ponticola TaxID=2720613 RepID=A0ABX1R853_9ALTE|nr:hypothetical protein [Alteromonas ponticola]NMH61423.1 hypothetical protein [Alteromonas ponticola]